MTTQDAKQVTIRLPVHLVTALETEAARRGIGFRALIRDLLFKAANNPAKPG